MEVEVIEEKALTVGFTEHHFNIAEDFTKRVLSLLGQHKKQKTYGIDSGDYEDRETIKFEISDKMTLEITLRTRKC